jgi:hypothetical protein
VINILPAPDIAIFQGGNYAAIIKAASYHIAAGMYTPFSVYID